MNRLTQSSCRKQVSKFLALGFKEVAAFKVEVKWSLEEGNPWVVWAR